MAKKYDISNNKGALFSVEDDVDDEEFVNHSQTGKSGYMLQNNIPFQPQREDHDNSHLERKRLQLLQKKKEIEERTIESSQRSLSILRNTEEVGVATAEELLRQREQLERTEKRLDDINATLRFSQKHIQGIKSVFGSLKNYFGGKNEPIPVSSNSVKPSVNDSPLYRELDRANEIPQIPSSALNSPLNLLGNEVENNDKFHRDEFMPGGSSQVHDVLDRNLEEICGSITKLKGLAHGLGEEIDSQNDLVENVLLKTDKADVNIQRQNKEIKRLLK